MEQGNFRSTKRTEKSLVTTIFSVEFVTCWSSRPADDTSMAPGVPTNIKEKRNAFLFDARWPYENNGRRPFLRLKRPEAKS